MAYLAAPKLLHDVAVVARSTLIALCMVGLLTDVATATSYWDRAKEGWFWYEDEPPDEPPNQPPDEPPNHPPDIDPSDPHVRAALRQWRVEEEVLPRLPVKWLKALQEVKLERALEEPTMPAVREYLLVHREHFRRSAQFSELWNLVLYTHPEMDPATTHPVSTAGLRISDQIRAEERAQTLASYANRAGLYFFFRQSCPYCRQFAPILKLFANQYGWEVFAITQDGGSLPEFPDARPDNGMGDAIGVRTVPAVYLAIPSTRFLAPVGQGFLTLSELEERILTILRNQARVRSQADLRPAFYSQEKP